MRILTVLLLVFGFQLGYTQEVQIDKEGFQTFEMTEGDTTYIMKQYVLCFLKKGENRDQSPEEATKIQEGHLAHMAKLAEENKIHIAGPLGDDGEIRGIVIYNVPSVAVADSLTSLDPAVKAGRLAVELHPLWAAKGSKLD